ncbi:MAG: hypothetical protein ACK4RF_04325 [Cyclobacteriaceae bacterium]
MEFHAYFHLWSKYRPVILQLMTAAAGESQQYRLSAHEFRASGEKVRSGYSFMLEAADGKALNNIKDSMVARDLLMVLQQSKTATQLMREATYELRMDKNFVLSVSRKPSATVAIREDQPK